MGVAFCVLGKARSPVSRHSIPFFVIGAALMVAGASRAAHAEIREATYEVQGVCFTGPDRAFDDALAMIANPGAVTNARPHMHVDWLIADGAIASRDELIGQCAIAFSQWTKGVDGNMHQHMYIPKGQMGIEFSKDPFPPDPEEGRRDGYVEDMDIEKARQDGLGSSGSTPTHEGHRRGAD